MTTFIVEESHLANRVKSGGKAVLSSPFLLAYIENTCYNEMMPGESVGVKVDMKHLKPSGIGDKIVCTITNIEKEEKRWIFSVQAHSNNTLIGVCEHTRYIV